MNWLLIILLALAAFSIAAFVLKLERKNWTLFAAILVFGLAGYATQGRPTQPSAAKAASEEVSASGEAMVEARKAIFDDLAPKPDYLTLADGFARRGKFVESAQILRRGLEDNPRHAEGWLALANSLVEHADGQLTPASLIAFGRADAADPGNPGVNYLLGFSFLRSGQPGQARQIWTEMLENAPEDAPWKADLAQRLELLEQQLAQGALGPAR